MKEVVVVRLPDAVRCAGPRTRMAGFSYAGGVVWPMVDEEADDNEKQTHGTACSAGNASVSDRGPPESIVLEVSALGGEGVVVDGIRKSQDFPTEKGAPDPRRRTRRTSDY